MIKHSFAQVTLHDQKFVDICQTKGGSINGKRESGNPVAFIDKHDVIESSGQMYPSTVRRVDCDFLCRRSAQFPQRCRLCQMFLLTLQSSVSQTTDTGDGRTNVSSHNRCSVLLSE